MFHMINITIKTNIKAGDFCRLSEALFLRSPHNALALESSYNSDIDLVDSS